MASSTDGGTDEQVSQKEIRGEAKVAASGHGEL